MMKLFLAPNTFTAEQMDLAKECLRVLESECGHLCALSSENSFRIFGDGRAARFSPEDCDVIVSLGGDGAVLRASRTAVSCGKRLLGVNGGRLGYLCALEYRDIHRFNALWPVLTCSQRRMLAVFHKDGRSLALNDVIIGKQSFGETVDLDIVVQNRSPRHIRGDGLIVATPTGSTGYNQSAGGPILDAELPTIVITPVCAHGSDPCSRVIADHMEIEVSPRNGSAMMYADGNAIGPLEGPILIRKAEESLSLYERPDRAD